MEYQEKLVDAIEEGKIVRVTEAYARQEALPILRKSPEIEAQQRTPQYLQEKKERPRDFKIDVIDTIKRAPTWKQKQVISELIDNWQWHIRNERRKKNISRTQLANSVGATEEQIKMLEFGTLPSEDFILINKIQKTLNINLRKDGKDFSMSVSDIMQQSLPKEKSYWEKLKEEKERKLSGKEIQILDDEI